MRDESQVREFEAALGKRVVLHYTEHREVPTTCFGETAYFVNRARVMQVSSSLVCGSRSPLVEEHGFPDAIFLPG